VGAGAVAAVSALGGRHRICLVVGQLALGGLERQVYLLATGLDQSRFEVVVVSMTRGGQWAEALRRAGVSVVEMGRRGHLDWRRLAGMVRVFRAIRPHLVYSFNYEANAYARLAGLLAGVPILVTGERAVYMSRRMRLLERVLIRFTECVICNAEAIRRDLIDRTGLPEDKIITIRNAVAIRPHPGPVERRSARQLIGATEDEIVVGTIAVLAARKNLTLLVRAASLCKAATRLRFCIVGGGPDEQAVRTAIHDHGVEDRFTLLGERDDAWTLLAGFDLFVLSSRVEGLPNALMEAMVAGLPCVCTDVGGCRELVAHGVTGYLVDPGDARALADRVVELAGDAALRSSMGGAGRERITDGYSVERLVSEVERVLLRLLEAAGSSARGRRLRGDFIEVR
jgi:glycosyltransferase involved in cell wall biosynthesis